MPTHTLVETLESRQLMTITAPWGFWPTATGQAKVAQVYPWLDGGGNGVAVIDKGIDYWHVALGGNRATNTKSPRIVNVYDYRDNDTDPFPSESEKTDPTSPHGTGVAGVLAGIPYVPAADGKRYQGVLQNSKLYNLRENRFDSQYSIKKALDWVYANYAKYHITAINLTDFVGTTAASPVYASEVQALSNAGIFIATPVANDWNNPAYPRMSISYPAKSPYIFGVGGILKTGAINPKSQRGAGLDILGPSDGLSLPYYIPSTNSDIWVNGYGAGNSWACAYVTGAAVLIQQIDPTIKPGDLMRILQDSGAYTADPDSKYTGIAGYKSLNIYNAVNLAYSRRDDVYDQGAGGNDDLYHAKAIPLNSAGSGGVSNLKLLIHDHDYFSFDVASASTYTLKTGYSGPSAFPQAQLLNASGAVIATIGSGGLTTNLAAGHYYLHAYNPSKSLFGVYSLTVTRSATVTAAAPKPAASSTPTAQNSLLKTDDSILA
jgi:hypothetical protein